MFSNGGYGGGGVVSFSPSGPPAAEASVAAAGAARTAKSEGAEKQDEPRAGPTASAGGGGHQSDTTSTRSSFATGSNNSGNEHADTASGDGPEKQHAAAEMAPAVGVGEEAGGGVGGSGSSTEPGRVPPEALREGGLVYLNTVTGEAVREPPEELVARADKAESAGEYLVFVPSYSFMAAASAASAAAASAPASTPCSSPSHGIVAAEAAAAAASRLSEAASAVGAAAESVLQAVVGDPLSSAREEARRPLRADCGAAAAAVVCERHGGQRAEQQGPHLSPLDTPTPPTVAKPVAGSSGESGSGVVNASGVGGGAGGGRGARGGEAWDRLSSLSMIDLSQGPASAPVDVEEAEAGRGKGAGGSGLGVAVEGAAVAAVAMWTCTACTLLNKARRTTCSVCGTSRPKGFVSQHVSIGMRGGGLARLCRLDVGNTFFYGCHLFRSAALCARRIHHEEERKAPRPLLALHPRSRTHGTV